MHLHLLPLYGHWWYWVPVTCTSNISAALRTPTHDREANIRFLRVHRQPFSFPPLPSLFSHQYDLLASALYWVSHRDGANFAFSPVQVPVVASKLCSTRGVPPERTRSAAPPRQQPATHQGPQEGPLGGRAPRASPLRRAVQRAPKRCVRSPLKPPSPLRPVHTPHNRVPPIPWCSRARI